MIRELDLRVQEKTLKMESTNNPKEKEELKAECICLSDEKIKTALQLEKELKKSINYINKKISVVQNDMVKHKEINQQPKVEVVKPPPKKFFNKKKGSKNN